MCDKEWLFIWADDLGAYGISDVDMLTDPNDSNRITVEDVVFGS
ncbi:hypothetical protein [Thermococcus camini]|nr:hypothetical protein [Thermococcus camini]